MLSLVPYHSLYLIDFLHKTGKVLAGSMYSCTPRLAILVERELTTVSVYEFQERNGWFYLWHKSTTYTSNIAREMRYHDRQTWVTCKFLSEIRDPQLTSLTSNQRAVFQKQECMGTDSLQKQ